MKRLIYIVVILFTAATLAQTKDSIPSLEEKMSIDLDVVNIQPKHKFASKIDENYYYWFRKKVFKAYPFAVLASKRLDTLNMNIAQIESKRKKRKYIRKAQEVTEDQLTDQLKKLTKTEGRILIKLIHRQTGKTTYENIKEFRSGFKAFVYNIQANLFNMSLKKEYKPATENEDFLIEDILQRAFISELLEEQDSKLNFNFNEISKNYKGSVNVEKYKKMFGKRRRKKKKKK